MVKKGADMTDAKPSALSADQSRQYWEDGFLFPLTVFSEDETTAFRAELEQIELDWLDADLPLPLNTYKRVNAHLVIPMAARIAKDARILDVVQGVLGPDIMVWSAELFIKEPRTKQTVGMHQDLTYWGMGETPDQVTAWIALSPATIESGCMDFVRASHKNPISSAQRHLFRHQPVVARAGNRGRGCRRTTKPILNWRRGRCPCTMA